MECEVCYTNPARRRIGGFGICEDCFSLLSKVRMGNQEAIQEMTQKLENASVTATQYIRDTINDVSNKEAALAVIPEKLQAIKRVSHNALVIPDCLAVNAALKQWVILDQTGNYGCVYNFSDLISYEISTDGNTIQGGSAGRAAIGALLFGTTGAVIGGAMSRKSKEIVNSVHIRLSINDIQHPREIINIINRPVRKDSGVYKNRMELMERAISAIDYIIHNNSERTIQKPLSNTAPTAPFSVADEILKMKQLMDAGIITQAEYEMQKRKLLSMN